jgi:hypothetical protein
LKVGIHVLGHLAETSDQAAEEFFPGYARAFTKIGWERGWPPVTRSQFDALRTSTGALFVGDANVVAGKILSVSEALGGLDRLSLQMSIGALPHSVALRSIDLVGREVIPRVRQRAANPA